LKAEVGLRLRNLEKNYRSSFLMEFGAHIHHTELRDINKNVPLLITESVTPVYFNNPAFTTLSIIEKIVLGTSQFEV
jgi:hypothetical protein